LRINDFGVWLGFMTVPLQVLLIMLAGWINRQQQALIEYLQEENRVLLEQLGGRPKRFTDDQRMRLTRKAKAVGRSKLLAIATVVTPDTLLRVGGGARPV
jgi:putative transposase